MSATRRDELLPGRKGELIGAGRASDRRQSRNVGAAGGKQASYVDLLDVTGLNTQVQRASAKANVLFIYSLSRRCATEKVK